MNNNITDTDIIIIECGTPSRINHFWIYITDTNWDKITDLIQSDNCKNISFFGSVNTIGDNWMDSCHNLESVDFSGLNSLESVGEFWMYSCTNLESIDFRGLSSLKEVYYILFDRCN